ncbi:sec24-related protein [Auricularia subglabra TFB-10046 SS5]|nr:sec24-related protein [Auricularia subglabra TFB-10046 SS5]
MDGVFKPISQPPHSSGQRFPGLRAHISPEQIPSPVTAAETDQAQWNKEYFCTGAAEQSPPLSSSHYEALDQGNSTPRFIRLSTYAMPKNSDLAHTCSMPLAAACQPFAVQPSNEAPVPLIDFGPAGPPRCSRCAGYINSCCSWTHGGAMWECNLCGAETEVAPEYFSNLNPLSQPMRRLDHEQRPELSLGTVDFAAPKEYWAARPVERLEPSFVSLPAPSTIAPRRPVPLHYVFAIEVTAEAVESGFTHAACEAIRSALYDEPLVPLTHVAIVTFDREISFYNVSPQLAQPHMLVLPDVDEVFTPLRDDLFADPGQSRELIDGLLESIPTRLFAQTTTRASALLPAVRAGLAALADTGGHLITFAHSLPTHGPGTLQPRADENGLYNTGKEKELFVPRDVLWTNLAEECAECGVGVSLVLGPRRFIDIGSIGVLPNLTGGDLFFFPTFAPERDAGALVRRVRILVASDAAYDVSVRVRCSKGLQVTGYAGQHHQTAPSTVQLGVLSSERMLLAVFQHTGSSTLDERGHAHVQCATLYTSRDGQRRVRVLNIAVNVSSMAGNVFRLSDVETVVAYLARRAVARMASKPLREIKDGLTEQTSSMLLAYRRNCAASTSPSQLILPESLKTLPMYTLSILKTKCLKGGGVNSDVRNFHAHLVFSRSVRSLLQHLYPRLLPLHALVPEVGTVGPHGRVVLPRALRIGHQWMQSDGLYLIENGVYAVLWIGYAVDRQLLQDVFGRTDVRGVPASELRVLPVLNTQASQQIRAVVECVLEENGSQLLLARQNEDGTEMAFGDMLLEDCNNDAMSYVDYLCFVHKHINAALTGETSIGETMGFRASTPW